MQEGFPHRPCEFGRGHVNLGVAVGSSSKAKKEVIVDKCCNIHCFVTAKCTKGFSLASVQGVLANKAEYKF